MFKKLKLNIVLLNVVLISLVVLLAFSFIYTAIYNNEMKVNREKLDTAFIRPQGFNRPQGENLPEQSNSSSSQSSSSVENSVSSSTTNPNSATSGSNNPPKELENMTSDYAVSFSVIVDENNKIVNSYSFLDISATDLQTAVETAKIQNENYSTVQISGERWIYKIGDLPKEFFGENMTSGSKFISFLRVSETYDSLNSLLITLIVAYIGIVIASFGISAYFAGKAVEPIKNNFTKQKEFIADASHEFKTPLAIIKADLDIVKTDNEMSIEERQKFYKKIDYETNKMTDLINSMLVLAQTENTLLGEINSFSVNEMIDNILLSVEVLMFERKITLSKQFDAEINIKTSRAEFERLVLILIDNAMKYTPENQSVSVHLKRMGKRCVVEVTNTGVNVSNEELPLLFERFYRADKSRSREHGSYGLGLPIAKSTAEKLNGTLTAFKPSENSVCFAISLPL